MGIFVDVINVFTKHQPYFVANIVCQWVKNKILNWKEPFDDQHAGCTKTSSWITCTIS